MKRIIPLLLLFVATSLSAQTNWLKKELPKSYKYRVYLSDKKGCGYSVRHPEAFLSKKAIARRRKFGLKVDSKDLPVSTPYLNNLRKAGMKVCLVSKWNNTAVVETADTLAAMQLTDLSFVDSIKLVYVSPDSIEVPFGRDDVSNMLDSTSNRYGHGEHQAKMIGADRLHNAGYTGKGVTIAVIDGGFHNADRLQALSSCRILGTRNFVNPHRNVFDEQEHGMMVLSCIGANSPYSLVGTALDAAFYLLLSEDGASEFLVEEDNWCAAVEYADSVGADIVTSSLGYYRFDVASMSHAYRELNGHTAINSRSASLAASRGLLLLNSAGNSGTNTWKKIGFPADAENILAVGAVNAEGINTNFSSVGFSADGRIKPDVMAMGQASRLLFTDGTVGRANGTSFSTPILCGGVACLVQAFPNLRPEIIIDAVRRSGNNAAHPDNIFGYGIPDLWKAYEFLKNGK